MSLGVLPYVRYETAQSSLGMAQQIHGPAVSSQGEFHVMGSQLESFQLVGFVQGKESCPGSDSHSRQELVNVVLVLICGNCKQKKKKKKKVNFNEKHNVGS